MTELTNVFSIIVKTRAAFAVATGILGSQNILTNLSVKALFLTCLSYSSQYMFQTVSDKMMRKSIDDWHSLINRSNSRAGPGVIS